MHKRLILIGNGMAGLRTLEELLKLDPGRYAITVYGAEPHGGYNRVLLSPVLAGETRGEDIITHDAGWYARHGITLHSGKRIVAIDRVRRRVRAEDGSEARYDRLLLATGSRPAMPEVPGRDLPGVMGFRALRDVAAMLEIARSQRRAVVVGGGLLGLEAATGLRRQGMEVTVVHRSHGLMNRQLDGAAADTLRGILERRAGLKFLLGARTQAILGRERVEAVRLSQGGETVDIPAGLVVMAVGIEPECGLARAAGLACGRGVLVDDTMQTYDPAIYAVGECVQHRGLTYGLVAPLYEQARVCANHLAELGWSRYRPAPLATRLKVSGVEVYSAGDYEGGKGCESLLLRDAARGIYRRLVLRDGRLVGAVLVGDASAANWYQELIESGAVIAPHRAHLMFGPQYAAAA